MAELKKNLGKYSTSSSGTGTIQHPADGAVQNLSGTFMTHIPTGVQAALGTYVVAGQVPMIFDNLPSRCPHRENRLVPIVVASAPARAALPNVPTVQGGGPGAR